MKFIKSKKGIAALIAAVVAVGALSFGAYAYFTNGGTGNNSTAASVGTVTNDFLVVVDAATGGTLYPTAVNSANRVVDDVAVHVTNQDEAAENLHQITYSVDGTSDPGCTAADFSIGGEAVGVPHTVTYDNDLAPNSDGAAATVTKHVSLQMIDSGSNQNACEGVTVNVKAVAA